MLATTLALKLGIWVETILMAPPVYRDRIEFDFRLENFKSLHAVYCWEIIMPGLNKELARSERHLPQSYFTRTI
jgi:hypothetical protein